LCRLVLFVLFLVLELVLEKRTFLTRMLRYTTEYEYENDDEDD